MFVPVPGKVTSLAAHEAFEMMLVNDGLRGYGTSLGTKLRFTKWKLNYLRTHNFSGEAVDTLLSEEKELSSNLIMAYLTDGRL